MQSNYIPWKGYFDLINQVDEFILYDDMQYTKNDWRNRNLIKVADGRQWLTIPVRQRGRSKQKILDVEVASNHWRRKHWQSLLIHYGKAHCFKQYRNCFERLYLDDDERFLSRINYRFLKLINEILGIGTRLSWSSDYVLQGNKSERLVGLCEAAGACEYVSGQAAKDYLELALFAEAGISVRWMDYSHYPVYRQLHPPFVHGVSILDLIFNEGATARHYMKSFAGNR